MSMRHKTSRIYLRALIVTSLQVCFLYRGRTGRATPWTGQRCREMARVRCHVIVCCRQQDLKHFTRFRQHRHGLWYVSLCTAAKWCDMEYYVFVSGPAVWRNSLPVQLLSPSIQSRSVSSWFENWCCSVIAMSLHARGVSLEGTPIDGYLVYLLISVVKSQSGRRQNQTLL